MLKTLDLPRQTSPGDAVLPNTTVLFTAPLYRPNLRYSIIPKPSSAAAVIDSIVDYILENHRGETGIICASLPLCFFPLHRRLTSHCPLQILSPVLTPKRWRRV